MFANAQRKTPGVFGFVVLAGVAILAGCGRVSSTSNGPTGSLQVALATTGSDGASYQFPAGTQLILVNGNSGFFAGYPIDGPTTALTESVPIGNYTATLSFANSGPVQLVRVSGGTSTTVSATWTDGQPFQFGVGQNITTPLVLHFSVVGLGDVTFQVGRVQVSIDVNATTTQMPGHGSESGTATTSFQIITPGFGLESPLGLTNGETDSLGLTFALIGGFTLETTGFACAPFSLTSFTTSSPSNTNAFNAVMEDIPGNGVSGVVCVQDQGTNDDVLVEIFRNGAAPDNQVSFLPDGNYQFQLITSFQDGDIFDGTTLKLSQLGAPVSFGAGNFGNWEHAIFDFNSAQFIEQSSGSFTGTFQLTP